MQKRSCKEIPKKFDIFFLIFVWHQKCVRSIGVFGENNLLIQIAYTKKKKEMRAYIFGSPHERAYIF